MGLREQPLLIKWAVGFVFWAVSNTLVLMFASMAISNEATGPAVIVWMFVFIAGFWYFSRRQPGTVKPSGTVNVNGQGD